MDYDSDFSDQDEKEEHREKYTEWWDGDIKDTNYDSLSKEVNSDVYFDRNKNYLFLSSRVVILQDIDKFLKKISENDAENYYIDPVFHTYDVYGKKLVGSGGNGTIYDYGKHVVKLTSYCNTPHGADICQDILKGGKVIKIPTAWNKKEMLMIPNYISELVVQIILNNPRPDFISEGFCKLNGFEFDDIGKTTYTSMEKLNPINDKIYGDGGLNKNLYYVTFQLAYFLYNAQLVYRFTHYDLHMGNVLCRPKDSDLVYEYYLNVKGEDYYIYTLYDFESVIIDFGFSNIETDKYTIVPKIRQLIRRYQFTDPMDNLVDLTNFNNFNPLYDLCVFIYSIFLSTKPYHNIDSESTKIISRLLFMIFGTIRYDVTQLNYDLLLELCSEFFLNGGTYWRPNPSKLAIDKINDVKLPYKVISPQFFLYNLMIYLYNEQPSDIINYDKYISKNNLLVTKNKIKFDLYKVKSFNLPVDNPEYRKNIHFDYGALVTRDKKSSVCDETMLYLQERYIDESLPLFQTHVPWIYTFSGGVIKDYRHQYFSQIGVITELAKKKGYEYDFVCCKVDIQSYMRSYDVEAGMAVNASFFQINDNYLPIGSYKSDDIISNIPIPPKYIKYYCAIVIDNKNLKLDHNVDEKYLKERYEKYLTCGPVLIKDGVNVFTPEMSDLMTKNAYGNDVSLFKCHNMKEFPQTYHIENCSNIRPGTLQHAGNPNPRTILSFTKENPNDPLFIYYEGRDQRGPGIDLFTLSELLLRNKIYNAVNLDGGMSSQLLWKEDNHIYINNPYHNFSYPVGNIITCVKKRK
jgi:hypothetical protein